MNFKDSLGDLALLVGLWLTWGFSWIVSKFGLAYASPIQMVSYRLLLGLLTLGALLLWRRTPLTRPPFWPTVWLGLTQTAGFTLLSTVALLTAGTGKVTLLCYTMPFWTLLLARIFLNEHLRLAQWGTVALALVGLICILNPWQQHTGWQGETLAVLAGLCWAVSAILAKRLRLQHQIDTLDLTFWQLLFGLIPLSLLLLLDTGPGPNWQPAFWAVLIFNGCISAGLGWLIWMHLLSRLPAGTAGLNALAIPAVALIFAWLWLGESPSALEWMGVGLIALALALLARLNNHLAQQ